MSAVCTAGGEAAVRDAQLPDLGLAVVDHRLAGISGAEVIRWVTTSPLPRLREHPLIGLSGTWAPSRSCARPAPAASSRSLGRARG